MHRSPRTHPDGVRAIRMRRACLGLLVLALLGGCGNDVRRTSAAAPPPAATAAPASSPVSSPVPSATPSAAAPAQLSETAFWRLVTDARRDAGNDTGRQSGLLTDRLRTLPPAQIAEFAAIRHRLDQRAYTWDVWAAAYVIEDGCSHDCFRDFRGYLISLGRSAYEGALTNPDSLAPVVQDAENGDWENADDPAPDAYSGVTGNDLPGGNSELSGQPRGTPWDDKQQDQLVRRYPALAARFR